MDKKIVFFDIDGTLVDNETHEIPESTKEAIQIMRKRGHIAVINTGRTWGNVDKKIRDIGFDGYICGCGTYVFYHGQWLLKSSLPHTLCIETVENFRKWNIPAFYEGFDGMYFDTEAGWIDDNIRLIKKTIGERAKEIPKEVSETDLNFDKFCLYFVSQSDKEKAMEWMEQYFCCIKREHGMMEIVPKGYSKATGIEYIRKQLQIPIENCYAIGDSMNDLPMLQAVPNSIVMGEAPEELVKICMFQTKKVMEDGIFFALRQYGLI